MASKSVLSHFLCLANKKSAKTDLGDRNMATIIAPLTGCMLPVYRLLTNRGSRPAPVATITGTVLKGKSCPQAGAGLASWRRSPTGAPYKTMLFSDFTHPPSRRQNGFILNDVAKKHLINIKESRDAQLCVSTTDGYLQISELPKFSATDIRCSTPIAGPTRIPIG